VAEASTGWASRKKRARSSSVTSISGR
jgi:hypothetical protein